MLSTTDLLVEHIISGVLSLIWIIALILCCTGIDYSILPILKDFWGLLAVVTTAIAYPIGIFMDTIADKLLKGWDRRIKNKYYPDKTINMIQLLFKLKDDNITSYFYNNRFKLRVSRSSALNFLLISLATSTFILVRGQDIGISNTAGIAITLFITFTLLSLTALYLWRDITITIHERVKRIWEQNIDLMTG